MAKMCVRCGRPIPFMEGVRHAEGMYCRQCDINDFVKQTSKDFWDKRPQTPKPPATPSVPTSASVADELKKFKELLDMGLIAQEDFDAKKKQLLGL